MIPGRDGSRMPAKFTTRDKRESAKEREEREKARGRKLERKKVGRKKRKRSREIKLQRNRRTRERKNSRSMTVSIERRGKILASIKYPSGDGGRRKMTRTHQLPIARPRREIPRDFARPGESSRNRESISAGETRVARIDPRVDQPDHDPLSGDIRPSISDPSTVGQSQEIWSVRGRCSNREIDHHVGYFCSSSQFLCLK